MKLTRAHFWIGLLVALPACAPEAETPGQEVAASAPNVVSLSATEYAIDAPDTIPAGWTNLRLANRGGEVHYGHMVRLEPGRSVQDLVAAYAEAIRTSSGRPKWVHRFGGPGGAMPGDSASVTQLLEPGSYVWICPVEDDSGTPHFAKGEFKPFVIRAADAGAGDRAAAGAAAGPAIDADISDFAHFFRSVHRMHVHRSKRVVKMPVEIPILHRAGRPCRGDYGRESSYMRLGGTWLLPAIPGP